MCLKKVISGVFIGLLSCSFLLMAESQTTSTKEVLQPTELENTKLAKLKAQDDNLNSNIQNIDSQMQILVAKKYIIQQAEQQKKSELLGLAEQIKREHDWNSSVNYDPNVGESGSFVKTTDEKKEVKK